MYRCKRVCNFLRQAEHGNVPVAGGVKCGFVSLNDDRIHMYLPMATARELARQRTG
jgi:hypothetical protein